MVDILPSELNIVAGDNTTVPDGSSGTVNVAENCPPGGINNAIRSLAAAIAAGWGGMYSGTSRPAAVRDNSFWLNTSSGKVLTFYDGTNDIPFLTVDGALFDLSVKDITVNSDVITGLAETADITAKTSGALIDAANLLEAILAAQNKVQTHHVDPESYTASADTHLSHMDVTITPSSSTSRVGLSANLSLEVNIGAPGSMIYVKRDGVEIGSAAAAGNRIHGLCPIPFDGDNASSMAQVSVNYIDAPATDSAVTYSFHVRMSASAVVTLNRTLNDTDTSIHERATSTAIAEEIGAA
jgi:hypothetical protein